MRAGASAGRWRAALKRWRTAALVRFTSWILRLWILSLRVRREGPAFVGPGVVAFWHGDQLPLLRVRPEVGAVAPISRSRDGDLQAALLGRLGVEAVRGSSSRGALAAARGLRRTLAAAGLVLVAVDGPRGPARQAKPGAVWLAQHGAVPLWPVGVAVSAGWRLRRPWDRYLLPLPFCRVVVVVGPPLRFDAGADAAAAAAHLTAALGAVGEQARRALGRRPRAPGLGAGGAANPEVEGADR